MSQVCSKCARANPPEAMYCYYDGGVLGGRAANGRPVQPGSQPFPSQFVFPSGQACRNFDQLAIACQQNWTCAVDLLKQGYLASFLAGIGRTDLALAAKEAARFPDTDRGLDRLLAKIPSQVLDPPKLRAEPTDVNLGITAIGTNRNFELHLTNLGMRLLYGSVSSDCRWLALGEPPGNPQKLFQFGGDAVIQVQVRGRYLRAGAKSLEGHLLIESNGGNTAVTVRAEVPPKPYPNGVLAGAATPRQVAEKALTAPREAAALFESGAVGKWFAANGWTYPVRGPSASGVGAVQQFFEALGMSKAPKVEISHTELALRGDVGQSIQAALELRTQEKRPVYGHALCDQPWLDVGRTVLDGRTAVIHVVVPHVPDRPGETLEANVTVTSNGNQKFKVPVSLEIGEAPIYAIAAAVPAGTGGSGAISVVQPIALAVNAAAPAVLAGSPSPAPVAPSDVAGPLVPIPLAPKRVPPTSAARLPLGNVIHAVPAALLTFFLFLVLGRDIFFAPQLVEDGIAVDPHPRIAVYFDPAMRFGLVALARDKSRPERMLTYSKNGETNSTVVKIGDQTRIFGLVAAPETEWVVKAEEIKSPWSKRDDTDRFTPGFKSVWRYRDSQNPNIAVQVTQLVEVVPGEPIELHNGTLKRYLDTCQIRYILENKGHEATRVGLRIMIDTLIGVDKTNDGVPFTVPGLSGLVDKSADFQAPKTIPDFLQVLEVPDLQHPGIVGFMNLKLGGGVEPPSRVLLTHWTIKLGIWDVPERPFLDPEDPRMRADSAVALYWGEKPLAKGAKRELGFSYGLGSLSVAGGQLGVSVGGSFVPRGDLTVVALVNHPGKGQKLTLKLPDGLSLLEGEREEQAVPIAQAGAASQQSPVTWRIRADREGTYVIEVMSSTGVSQKKRIAIKTKTIF